MTFNRQHTLQLLALVFIVVLASTTLTPLQAQDTLKAFPGAEGFGTNTVHGRGGEVIPVTNLNDSGAGSLRAALEASGPRIVVFRVSGIIELNDQIRIDDPYVYLAGQSAPGDGITIKGARLVIDTHDVVIRFVRIRPGDNPSEPTSNSRDAITIQSNDAYNIVIDHSSISWAMDENISTWGPVRDVTLQWNIVSEGLPNPLTSSDSHSMAILIGDRATNISIHHNLMAHNSERTPYLRSGSLSDIVNNVIYNWGEKGAQASTPGFYRDPIRMNFVNNYFKEGADTDNREFNIKLDNTRSGSGFYFSGNIGPSRPNNNGDEYAITNMDADRYKLSNPLSVPPVTIWDTTEAYEFVLAGAGATYPIRDSVDARVVNDARNGTGRLIDRVAETPGYHNFRPAQPPADADLDGMPDQWELARGLDPNNRNDAAVDRNNDGYTNIEEYLNEIVADVMSNVRGDTDNPTPVPQPTEEPIEPDQPDEPDVPDAPVTQLAVTGFVLVNAGTNQDVRPLVNGDTLQLDSLPVNLSIRATTDGPTGSVSFSTPQESNFWIENVTPYAINGDTDGNYNAYPLPAGDYQLQATPYTERNAQGEQGTPLSVNFTIADTNDDPESVPVENPSEPDDEPQTSPAQITDLVLVDAQTNQDIRPIINGDTLNLTELPPQLTLRAVTDGNVQVVTFGYVDEPILQTEGEAPYAFNGDTNGDNYRPAEFRPGTNVIVTRAYADSDADDTPSDELTLGFTVVTENTPPPTPEVPTVTGFVLVNADTNQDIRTLSNSDTIDLTQLPPNLSLRVTTAPAQVGSVAFSTPNNSNFRTENVAPYALNGDTNGDYVPVQFSEGTTALTAVAYTEEDRQGLGGRPLQINFNVINPTEVVVQPDTPPNNDDSTQAPGLDQPDAPNTPQPPSNPNPDPPSNPDPNPNPPSNPDPNPDPTSNPNPQPTGLAVTSFTLVNADTDQDIRTVNNGATLDLSDLPDNLTFRANVSGDVQSVRFQFTGSPSSNTEGEAPYALAGDVNTDDYKPMPTMSTGQHQLTATARGDGGERSDPYTITFQVRE